MARPFVIAFVGRSGSTAIRHDLDQHPDIAMRAEAMGGKKLPPWPGPREPNDDNRLGWLRHEWAGESEAARGFKLQFDRAAPQFDEPSRLAEELRRHEAVVFRLRRTDRLRHAVAVLRGEALREISRRVSGQPAGNIQAGSHAEVQAFAHRPIEVHLAALELALDGLAMNHADLDDFLAGFPDAVELTYEAYLADRLSVLNQVADAVGVAPFAEAPRETLRKISSDDLRRAVANYDEVADVARRRGLPVQ